MIAIGVLVSAPLLAHVASEIGGRFGGAPAVPQDIATTEVVPASPAQSQSTSHSTSTPPAPFPSQGVAPPTMAGPIDPVPTLDPTPMAPGEAMPAQAPIAPVVQQPMPDRGGVGGRMAMSGDATPTPGSGDRAIGMGITPEAERY